jgi:hypothetical protein
MSMDAWTWVPLIGLAATVPFWLWYFAKGRKALHKRRHPAE